MDYAERRRPDRVSHRIRSGVPLLSEYRLYIWEALLRVKARGKAVLFATHLVTEVERHCDGFYFLKDGAMRHFDSAAQLRAEYGGESLEETFVNYVTQ